MSIAAEPLTPKNPSKGLNVVAIGRISTEHQDVENIEASYRYIQDYLHRIHDGPMNIKPLGEQASGMLTDRATIREAEALVASGEVDLVIAEDLARIYRNPRYQYDFVQNSVDMGTRVICIGDNLDTADENWEITMGAAALRHGLHIPDTRRRVRRTATHSFHKGGMVQKLRYGYRKLSPEEAASGDFGPKDLRIAKRPECTPIIQEMVQRVMRGDSYAAIAEWLEAEGVEPGPYVENRRWTGRLVVELLEDPILCGTRTFRDTICRPVFRTGRHKPIKNDQPETKHYAELVHITLEEHEAVCREISRRRAAYRDSNGQSARRRGVPRRRTIWPGQSATCAICGGLMYYVGDKLKCRGSLPRFRVQCWNHVQLPAQLTRRRVLHWLVQHLEATPDLRRAMAEVVWSQLQGPSSDSRRQRCLDREIATLEKQASNLTSAIAQGGELQTLVGRLQTVEDALKKAREAQQAEPEQTAKSQAPSSKRRVEQNLGEALDGLLGGSLEFTDVMRRLFPEFIIQPVQALDTGQVHPRGRLRFSPDGLGKPEGQNDRANGDIWVVLDLFEPPKHIAVLDRCLELRAENPKLSLRRIAAQLDVSYMTVKRALAYAKRMDESGMNEPYQEVHERPTNASRWR